jgi:hypothetical protein
MKQKVSISKAKKQSDVGHILLRSGNISQRTCSTRSDGEKGILYGSIFFFGSKNSLSTSLVSGKKEPVLHA